jgi:FkbM family methyltransferase
MKNIIKKILKKLGFDSSSDQKILSVYQNLLGRQAEADELLHWKLTGNNIDVIRKSIIASYEYEQKQLSQQRVLVDIKMFKIYASTSDTDIGQSIIKSKIWEPHVTDALKKVLGVGDVFLDLGANIGYFSLLAASIVQESGKVISFEPNIQNLHLLYLSILENHFNNIKVYPLAASVSSQILKITSFGSNGFLEKPSDDIVQSNFQFIQSVIVDELLHSEEKVDVVKMDIEGYEPLALRGMDKLIKKHNPVIITEFSPWHIKRRSQIEPLEYLKQLAHYGYSLFIIEQSGCLKSVPNPDFLMNLWESFNNDKQHLDLIAQSHKKKLFKDLD